MADALAAPSAPLARPRALSWRALRFWCFRWSRTWRSTLAGNVVYPLVYLAAIGIGLGHLVNHHLAADHGAGTIGGVSYLAFVTPGILAASMMQIAVHEATYPVMGAIRWDYAYLGQLASPLRIGDIVFGHLGFIGVRALFASSFFLAVAAAFGALSSPEAIVGVPIAIVVALAFGAPVAAFAVTRDNDSAFSSIQRLGVVPLFLFSGCFFPIGELPEVLRVLAVCTPLYQGVVLERACSLGTLGAPENLAHGAYLLVMATGGFLVARRTYQHRLAR
ncbi:MAG: ABC transporter permease [Actinomycetota bacterium]|nr:ABC transporter permease [Actinomycetota bacterium]